MQSKREAGDADSASSFRRSWCISSGSPVRHILAPTDLTAQSNASVACAVRLARSFNAKLTLLHVWPGSDRADLPSSPLYAGQLELDARRVLEESQKAERDLRVMRNRIRVHHALTEDCFLLGDPGPLTLWVARECHVDLMVISGPHYGWLDRLLARRYSDKIVRDARCSVLVIPPIEQECVVAEPDYWLSKKRQVKAGFAWAKEKS